MNCDYDYGYDYDCGAGGANVIETDKMNVIDLNLTSNAFIRVVKPLIIFIN